MIFSILIFFKKVIQKSHCCWGLAQVCTAPILSQSEEIFKEVQKQAKVTLPTGNHRTLPHRDKKRVTARKWQKRVWVWCLTLVVFSLSNHADRFSLAWCSLTAQEKGIFKRIKNELKVVMSSRASARGCPH